MNLPIRWLLRLGCMRPGIFGELYVGGAQARQRAKAVQTLHALMQVGAGYLHRPDLTAERFVWSLQSR